jgi:hypothetical protein
VLSRASSANKSVLRTLEPLDFGILERGPIGFAVAETAHVTFHDLLKRHAHKFRRPEVPCDVHLALSRSGKDGIGNSGQSYLC